MLHFITLLFLIFLRLNNLAVVYGNCDTNAILKREGVIVKCETPDGAEVSCQSGNVPSGTVANYRCDSFYVPILGDSFSGKLTCSSRGRWAPLQDFHRFSCAQDCGSAYTLSPFVIGGVTVDRQKYPWHASIFARLNSDEKFRYICGGTLVNPFSKGLVILTAAHCLATSNGKPRDQNNVRIVLGADSSNLEENLDIEGAKVHKVRDIILHDSYEGETFQADIAIVVLEGKVKLSYNIIPACFGQGVEKDYTGNIGEVVGFGRFGFKPEESATSLKLRQVELPVVDLKKCESWRSRKLFHEICAGYEDGKSTCNGDSGGGFIFKNNHLNKDRYFIQGIVSHGRKSVEDNSYSCDSYSVFTKVNSHAAWIRRKMDALSIDEDHSPSIEEMVTKKTISRPNFQENRPQSQPSSTLNQGANSQYQKPTYRPNNPYPYPTPPKEAEYVTISSVQSKINAKDYEKSSLDRHNYYRKLHGVPNLKLSSNLNKKAQAYADKLIREGSFENEPENGINKNLYFMTTYRNVKLDEVAANAVDKWYESISKYSFDRPSVTSFSQVVWKSTTEIGVGIGRLKERIVVVTAYAPPGNIQGNNFILFKNNVFPSTEK